VKQGLHARLPISAHAESTPCSNLLIDIHVEWLHYSLVFPAPYHLFSDGILSAAKERGIPVYHDSGEGEMSFVGGKDRCPILTHM